VDLPNGFYWGGNAGIAEEEDSCNELPVAPGFQEQPGCDNTDFAWQLYVGYQFIKWISLEGGFVDLGGSEFRIYQTSLTTSSRGWTLGGAITLPYLEKAGIYAIGGAYFWDREGIVDVVGLEPVKASDRGTDYYWGAALRYPFSEKVGISLEVKNFVDVGSSEIGTSDYGMYSAGLTFRF
jgi:hypothetical protein